MILKDISVLSESHVYFFPNYLKSSTLYSILVILLIHHSIAERSDMVK